MWPVSILYVIVLLPIMAKKSGTVIFRKPHLAGQ